MRKIIYLVHVSLDGYIEGPNGEFDWPVMRPELSAYAYGLHDRVDTLLFGRVVWDMMAAFWPNVESASDDEHDLAFGRYWRETPKVVFSRTLEKAGWNTRVTSDVAGEIAELKRQPGKDLLLTGGSTLAAALTGLGEIDEYHLVVHPVVLGGGKPLFPEPGGRLGMRLMDARTLDSTTVVMRYRRAG